MADRGRVHLTDEQLAGLPHSELSARDAVHLETCSECTRRLDEVRSAEAAYMEYRDSVRGPSLPPAPRPWKSLDALIAEHQAGRAAPVFRWWYTAAIVATAAMVVALAVWHKPTNTDSLGTDELLARASAVRLPEARRIRMRIDGRTFIRPAVLVSGSAGERDPEMERLRQLFEAAQYEWREPLSARSFQSWRSRHPARRDSVTEVRRGEERAYRVRTDVDLGVLRSASLTFAARDLRATNGTFEFTGQASVEIEEGGPRDAPAVKPSAPSMTTERPVEAPASPSDALQVLAALNRIGADVGQPIEVTEDAHHGKIVVRVGGLSPDLQQQVAEALRPMHQVTVDLQPPDSSAAAPRRPTAAEQSVASMPASVRQQLEERAGGAVALQELTDRLLETSASVLARAHSVQLLARLFPTEIEAGFSPAHRELLHVLLRRHTAELRRLDSHIRADINILLSRSGTPAPLESRSAPWQSIMPTLVESAQALDDSLNRLLAGSYSLSEGEALITALPAQMDRLESSIAAEER